MKDLPGAIERPTDCAIAIDDSGDLVAVAIPARPLGLLWLVFAFNMGALVLFAALGVIYLIFHVPLINGLPLTPPKAHTPAAAHWFAGFGIGWLAAQSALIYGFCLIWFP